MNLDDILREPLNRVPRYSLPEASHYLSMSPSVLETWVRGRKLESGGFSPPLIGRAATSSELSFLDLVEAFVLKGLRSGGTPMAGVRIAIDYWQAKWSVERPLLDKRLRTLGGAIFRDGSDSLLDVSKGGQDSFRFLEPYLERIVFDGESLPNRFFPFTRGETTSGPQVVSISPVVAYGQPVVDRRAVRTSIIASRFKRGESHRGLAGDFGLTVREVEEAIRYEQAPHKAAAA